MTRQNEEDTNTIWEFLQESAGDAARVIGAGGVVTLIGGVWAYGHVVDAMRPIFGQSAGSVTCIGSGLFAVTLGGVTYYFVRKHRRAHPGQPQPVSGPGPQPLTPQSSMMDRVINMMNAPRNPPQPISNDGGERPSVREVNDVAQSWIEMKRISEELHILSLGGTGAGKTVFFTAVSQLAIEDGGKIYVLDGKPGMGWEQKWPNATRKFKDPGLFVPFLKTAVVQMERRIAAGKHRFPGMYIVVDEAQRVTGQYDEAVELIADLSSRGREYNIHVWLLSQAATADLIGFGGKMAVLEKNFTAVELMRENDRYQFSYARFAGGGIKSVGERYITPRLPSPWDDTSDAPVWDDASEFAVFQAPETAVSIPVKSAVSNGNGAGVVATIQEEYPPSRSETFHVETDAADEPKSASKIVKDMMAALTEDSEYKIGKRYLTYGQSSAIAFLNHIGWSKRAIMLEVFGSINGQNHEAVNNVLGEFENEADY